MPCKQQFAQNSYRLDIQKTAKSLISFLSHRASHSQYHYSIWHEMLWLTATWDILEKGMRVQDGIVRALTRSVLFSPDLSFLRPHSAVPTSKARRLRREKQEGKFSYWGCKYRKLCKAAATFSCCKSTLCSGYLLITNTKFAPSLFYPIKQIIHKC